jgi:hypothetical protein
MLQPSHQERVYSNHIIHGICSMNEKTAHSELPGVVQLWSGWFIGVAAWGLHLFLSYALVEWYCVNPTVLQPATVKIGLHGLTIICFALALYGGRLVWRIHRTLQVNGEEVSNGGRGWVRSRFMTCGGIMLTGFMAVLILVEGIPNFVFEPCL